MAISQIADWQLRQGKKSDIEKTELLASVATVQWPLRFEVFGRYLSAGVYRKMGILSAANEELDRVVEFANHSWIHRKVTAQFGQNLIDMDQPEQARQVIQTVLLDHQREEDVPLWISLAELEYKQSNLEQAANHCRMILDLASDDDQKSVALRLLGQIYQQRGLHRHAALCFSGVLPSPSQ